MSIQSTISVVFSFQLSLLSSLSYGQEGRQRSGDQNRKDRIYSYSFGNDGTRIHCEVKFNPNINNYISSIATGTNNPFKRYVILRDSIEEWKLPKYFNYQNYQPSLYSRKILPSRQFAKDSSGLLTDEIYLIPKGTYLSFTNLIFNNFHYQNFNAFNSVHLNITKSTAILLLFTGGTVKNLLIHDSKFNEISFINCSLDTIGISASCRELRFGNCKILRNPTLLLDSNLERISFRNCDFSSMNNVVDLTHLIDKGRKQTCVLSLEKVDLNKIKFNYNDFILDTRYMSMEEVVSMYKLLIDKFAREGMTSDYQAATIDLKNIQARGNYYNRVINYFDKHWWNYGFNKELIIRNSLILFLFFFITNSIIGLRKLLSKGYEIDGFDNVLGGLNNKTKINKIFRKTMYTLVYTSFVFWGLNLEKKKLKIERIRYFLYILLQYLAGLICVAYLAAYILSK